VSPAQNGAWNPLSTRHGSPNKLARHGSTKERKKISTTRSTHDSDPKKRRKHLILVGHALFFLLRIYMHTIAQFDSTFFFKVGFASVCVFDVLIDYIDQVTHGENIHAWIPNEVIHKLSPDAAGFSLYECIINHRRQNIGIYMSWPHIFNCSQ
jgi:hypothetical protein